MWHLLASSIDKSDIGIIIATALIISLLFKVGQRGLLSIVESDHFWQNLDKFMIVGLFIVVMFIAVHMLHHGSDQSSITWVQNTAGQLLSALLALLGARALQRKADGNGNGNGNGNGDTHIDPTPSKVVVDVKPPQVTLVKEK